MRTAVKAGLADDSSELTKSEELNPDIMAKLKERYDWRGGNVVLINSASAGVGRWRPPLVVKSWHASCQAIYRGVERAEWENLHYKFVEHEQGGQRSPPEWEQQGNKV